jgi:polyol transport system substrate-binding protein
VDIPEFQNLGDQVSQQFQAAIAGTASIDAALQQAQALAEAVGKNYQK